MFCVKLYVALSTDGTFKSLREMVVSGVWREMDGVEDRSDLYVRISIRIFD